MMFSSDQYSHAVLPELNAKLVVIPYKGRRFSMQVFIPNEIGGLEGFLEALPNTTMHQIKSKIRPTSQCDSLSIRLPKFKIESTLSLAEPVKQIGARAMFSATDADFGGISEGAELFVSDGRDPESIHCIEVDEDGTEATAESAIRTELTCGGQTIKMKADRPFYYQIVDEDRNLIIFTGIVVDPSA